MHFKVAKPSAESNFLSALHWKKDKSSGNVDLVYSIDADIGQLKEIDAVIRAIDPTKILGVPDEEFEFMGCNVAFMAV